MINVFLKVNITAGNADKPSNMNENNISSNIKDTFIITSEDSVKTFRSFSEISLYQIQNVVMNIVFYNFCESPIK